MAYKRQRSRAKAHVLVQHLARSCRTKRRAYLDSLDMNDVRRLQAYWGWPRDNNRTTATNRILKEIER